MQTISSKVYDSPEELALIRCVKKGDDSAFTPLYHKYFSHLKMIVFGIVKDEEIAEGIVQETLTKAWENLRGHSLKRGKDGVLRQVKMPGFNEQSKFSTWLTRVAMNEGFMYLRKNKTMASLSIISDDEKKLDYQHLAVRDLDIEGIADRQVIKAAIKRTPPQYHHALYLRFWEGLSVEDVRKSLGERNHKEVTLSCVKTILFRGRRIMQGHINNLSNQRRKQNESNKENQRSPTS